MDIAAFIAATRRYDTYRADPKPVGLVLGLIAALGRLATCATHGKNREALILSVGHVAWHLARIAETQGQADRLATTAASLSQGTIGEMLETVGYMAEELAVDFTPSPPSDTARFGMAGLPASCWAELAAFARRYGFTVESAMQSHVDMLAAKHAVARSNA